MPVLALVSPTVVLEGTAFGCLADPVQVAERLGDDRSPPDRVIVAVMSDHAHMDVMFVSRAFHHDRPTDVTSARVVRSEEGLYIRGWVSQ